MNYKNTASYAFIVASVLLFLACLLLVIRSCKANKLLTKGQTRTHQRAKRNKINIGMTKEDFHTESSTMLFFNIDRERFVFIYNGNQMKIVQREKLESFSDGFLGKRMTPFGELLWKYIEMSRILLMPVLKFERTMGRFIANNRDYTQDLVSYSNFCLNFLADDKDS